MPLRDHFRPLLDDITSWDGLYGGWPAMVTRALSHTLPPGYAAGPRICLAGSAEKVYSNESPEVDEYEVHVNERKRGGRRRVATIEFVSPTNKDRPEHRRALVTKCAALLQQGLSVTIIDLVTTYNFNLYCDLLELIGQSDPAIGSEPPPLYAVACRQLRKGESRVVEVWAHTLTLGQPLPTLPLWLADSLAVPLELEPSYEETCHILRIP